jgi:hypothetical protein
MADYVVENHANDVFTFTNDIAGPLHEARRNYWLDSSNHHLWDNLCDKIRKHLPPSYLSSSFTLTQKPFTKIRDINKDTQSHSYLFGDLPSNVSLTKEQALKKIYAEIYTEFINPEEKCITYLQRINNDFERYFIKKHKISFPTLERDDIVFERIEDKFFPIPSSESFKGIKKYSALQEFLSGLFQHDGFGYEAAKWIGFIDANVADPFVQAGNFFTEERLGEGLFHGKISHMLQWAMILYMMKDGCFSVPYQENGQNKNLTIKDVISHLVIIKTIGDQNIWQQLLDMDGTHRFTFPHYLNSLIMLFGRTLKMPHLSDYLTDTFCKGFIKLLHTHNLHLNKQSTLSDLHKIMSDRFPRIFGIYEPLLKYARANDEKKGLIEPSVPTRPFYLSKRNYQVNKNFDFSLENRAHTNRL